MKHALLAFGKLTDTKECESPNLFTKTEGYLEDDFIIGSGESPPEWFARQFTIKNAQMETARQRWLMRSTKQRSGHSAPSLNLPAAVSDNDTPPVSISGTSGSGSINIEPTVPSLSSTMHTGVSDGHPAEPPRPPVGEIKKEETIPSSLPGPIRNDNNNPIILSSPVRGPDDNDQFIPDNLNLAGPLPPHPLSLMDINDVSLSSSSSIAAVHPSSSDVRPPKSSSSSDFKNNGDGKMKPKAKMDGDNEENPIPRNGRGWKRGGSASDSSSDNSKNEKLKTKHKKKKKKNGDPHMPPSSDDSSSPSDFDSRRRRDKKARKTVNPKVERKSRNSSDLDHEEERNGLLPNGHSLVAQWVNDSLLIGVYQNSGPGHSKVKAEMYENKSKV